MDFGSLAGGLADGFKEGSDLYGKQQASNLTKEQLQQLLASNQGAQAYFNTLMPGGQSIPIDPAAKGINNFELPAMGQMPIIGKAGADLGLWAQPPGSAPSGMPMPQQNPMLSGPAAPGGGGGMPPPGGQGGPVAAGTPGAPMAQPTGRMQGGQPIESARAAEVTSPPPTPQAVAMAIDRANPGLRQSNPRAFTEAVKFGLAQLTQQQSMGSEQALNAAKIEELKSQAQHQQAQAGMEGQRGNYYGSRAQMQQTGNKALTTMYTQNEQAIRHLQTQDTKIASAFDIKPPEKAQMRAAIKEQLQGLFAKRDEMVKQMRGEGGTGGQESKPTSAAANPQTTIPLKISDKNIEKLKKMTKQELMATFEAFKAKGVSDETLNQLARMITQ